MEFTGLKARREFDQKTQLHLPVLGERGDAVKLTDFDKHSEQKESGLRVEKKEDKDDLPGGLDEIIRDLTRRPPP